MKSSYLITGVVIVAFVALLFFVVQLGGMGFVSDIAGVQPSDTTTEASRTELVGNQAPYFDLPDLAGNHTRLGDFSDTPLILVFWSTWNSEAADEIQILDQYLQDHKNQQLVKVLTIDSQEEKSVVSSFMRRGGYEVPTVIDAQGATSEEYHIKSLPTLYFIDRTGLIRDAYAGVLSEKSLVDKIEAIVQ